MLFKCQHTVFRGEHSASFRMFFLMCQKKCWSGRFSLSMSCFSSGRLSVKRRREFRSGSSFRGASPWASSLKPLKNLSIFAAGCRQQGRVPCYRSMSAWCSSGTRTPLSSTCQRHFQKVAVHVSGSLDCLKCRCTMACGKCSHEAAAAPERSREPSRRTARVCAGKFLISHEWTVSNHSGTSP